MAVSVTHTFVSPVADAGDPDIVGPNEWNDAHQVTGLGTAAEADVGDFATAAQGTLADSATQPGDLSAVATSGAYSDLSGKPTLGTAAAANTGDFATAAQGATADTAVQPGDLATVATTGDYNDLINTPGGGGSGDMTAAVYDPQNIADDAFDRANHTGAQTASTISDFSTEADARISAAVGVSVQAYSANLAEWSGINPSANGGSLVAAADYSAMRTLLSLVPGTNVQAYDADLTTWAGLTPSANAQSLVTAADYAAMRTLLGLVIGTNVQAYDADLASWAGVTRASGFDTFAATPSSANLRSLLSDEVGTGAAYFVGGALGTPASGTATNLTGLPLSSGVTGQLPLANGGTGANLSDPNADRILFWDDSAGAMTWLTPGTGLTITSTTIDAAGGGGLTLGTPQATTSGSTITFSSIPAGVKQITLSWRDGSTNGTGQIYVQIGDSGGLETSGYTGGTLTFLSTPNILRSAWSSGALLQNNNDTALVFQSMITLVLADASTNTWQISISTTANNGASSGFSGPGNGYKSLSATLDRIALITANTFDAGSVNIAYAS